MKNITFYLIYPFAYMVGLLPYKLQLILGDVLYIFLYKIIHYRVGVVRENLKNSFSTKSKDELLDIENKYYHHLADLFVETLSLASISKEEIKRRMNFLNTSQMEQFIQGRSWICAMSHYGSWEYTVSHGLHTINDGVLPVYRPLSDKGMDKMFYKMRSRFNTKPIAMAKIGRELILAKRDNKTYTVALISDQNAPHFSKHDRWEEFLGRKTAFFVGMEQLALKYNLPVAFLHMDKIKRGYYIAWLEVIYDGKEKVEQGEIVHRYVKRLEAMIRDRPELWVWSHRRWKLKYEDYH